MPPRRLDSMLWAALSRRHEDPRPDAELLARFLNDRDEQAFEALLVRHAPAVRAACRAWLRSAADIDDAAQATFLVLVQRAGSIRDRTILGPWLYRVAVNVSRRLRQRPASYPLPDDLPGLGTPDASDLGELLAEEVARLPEKYRQPLHLCYQAGLTTAEAAHYLGWPKGTVLTRLAWAREQLKKRLAHRGVAEGPLAGLLLPAEAVSRPWVSGTARIARGILAGKSLVGAGASERTVSLAKGVVRAMMWKRLKYAALAALLALGGIGLGIHRWAAASGPGASGARSTEVADARGAAKLPAPQGKEKEPRGPVAAPTENERAKPAEARPGRRREALIRLPIGKFVKEVDVRPHGSGRLTWVYEEERVLGLIEASVMGGEIELATEAEYSLSSNGTIYGLITSVQLKHLRLPEGKDLDELKPFVGLLSAAEPLVNEVVMDMPFSYQFRVQGNRLIISNFRMLLAGPNPLGKLGGLAAGKEVGTALTAFQALGTAVEGTYTLDDGMERPALNRSRPLGRPRTGTDRKMK